MLTERQIMCQVFLSDVLNVVLKNDNLKVFNHVRDESLLALRNDLDEHVVENLYERQVEKSALMQHANTLYQQDSVQKKEPRSFEKLKLVVDDILERQQNLLISRKFIKGKKLSFIDDRAQKAENALANMMRPRQGREKVIDQEDRWKKHSAERQFVRKTGRSPSDKEDRPPRLYKKGHRSCDWECDCCHPSHCRYLTHSNCQMGKDCAFVHSQHKNPSTSPKRKKEYVWQSCYCNLGCCTRTARTARTIWKSWMYHPSLKLLPKVCGEIWVGHATASSDSMIPVHTKTWCAETGQFLIYSRSWRLVTGTCTGTRGSFRQRALWVDACKFQRVARVWWEGHRVGAQGSCRGYRRWRRPESALCHSLLFKRLCLRARMVRSRMFPTFWSHGDQVKTRWPLACSQAIEYCCCPQVVLFIRSVSQSDRLWTIAGFLSLILELWRMFQTISWNRSAPSQERRGVLGHIGEIEQIEDPINASTMLKWIEQSCGVAESMKIWCVVQVRLKAVIGKDRFCAPTSMFPATVSDVFVENSALLWRPPMSEHLFSNVSVGRRGLLPLGSSRTWRIPILAPLFQPGPGSDFSVQHAPLPWTVGWMGCNELTTEISSPL